MINLDKHILEIECPKCKFYNKISLQQVRTRDIIICRGCKINIQLEDFMNEYRKVKRKVERSFQELKKSFDNLNFKLEL